MSKRFKPPGNWFEKSGEHSGPVITYRPICLRYLGCYGGRSYNDHHAARGPQVDVEETIGLEVLVCDVGEHVLIVSFVGQGIETTFQVKKVAEEKVMVGSEGLDERQSSVTRRK